MDPSRTAQDVARCDLCETTIAESHCDFCHVNLCRSCIGEHITVDYKRKHTIVPFLQRKSTLIYPKCETHPEKSCKYKCKECNIFLCSNCFASKLHPEHEFLKLETMFKEAKKHIRMDREELKKQILPTYNAIADDLENQISHLDGEYMKLRSEMSKQREKMHKELDESINQMENKIGNIKANHHNILKKHLDEVKTTQTLVLQTVHTLNEMEESNDVFSTISYKSKNQTFSTLPPEVIVTMPKFISEQAGRKLKIGDITPMSTKLMNRNVETMPTFNAKDSTPVSTKPLDRIEQTRSWHEWFFGLITFTVYILILVYPSEIILHVNIITVIFLVLVLVEQTRSLHEWLFALIAFTVCILILFFPSEIILIIASVIFLVLVLVFYGVKFPWYVFKFLWYCLFGYRIPVSTNLVNSNEKTRFWMMWLFYLIIFLVLCYTFDKIFWCLFFISLLWHGLLFLWYGLKLLYYIILL